MIRKIIKIDEDKCNGCSACVNACHEGAIAMIDGKAKLIRDDYCDGMGDCLPECPTGAISFEEREAKAYDEKAVIENKKKLNHNHAGCSGSQIRQIKKRQENLMQNQVKMQSELTNWPVQIKLAPFKSSHYDGAKLLIAADCTAFAYASFHQEFISDSVTLIGCPKLDAVDYSDKLTEIIKNNDIKSVTIVRMEVPCCGKIEAAAKKALQQSGKFIPWQVKTISIDGKIINN